MLGLLRLALAFLVFLAFFVLLTFLQGGLRLRARLVVVDLVNRALYVMSAAELAVVI